MATLTDVLAAASSMDNVLRPQAEAALRELEATNYEMYLVQLSEVLKNDGLPEGMRQLAALLIKGALDAESDLLAQQRELRWKNSSPAMRSVVKDNLIMSLSAVHDRARSGAAQAIAKVAKIELPAGQWSELIPGLSGAAIEATVALPTRVAALLTMGFVCCDLPNSDSIKPEEADALMTALLTNLQAASPPEAQHRAILALEHALDFIEPIMKGNPDGAAAIIGAIVTSAQSADNEVSMPAFSCIAKMADLYYAFLEPFIDTLVSVTVSAATSGNASIDAKALEFWIAVATQESVMGPDDADNRFYVRSHLGPLVAMLTQLMTKVEEDNDEDNDFTVAEAASRCLESVAEAVGDDVVGPVMAFAGDNLHAAEWNKRDAAIVAVGNILDGPKPTTLAPVLDGALPVLLSWIAGEKRDPNAHVRDSAAWAVARIMDSFIDHIDISTHFQPTLAAAVVALDDVSRVASNAAYIIMNTAEGVKHHILEDGSSPLTPYYETLMNKLLGAAFRSDWMMHKLRWSCREAVMALISAATEREQPYLMATIVPSAITALQATFTATITTTDQRKDVETQQELLCSVLYFAIPELDDKIAPVANEIVSLLLRVLDSPSSGAAEDAYRALGALVVAMGAAAEVVMATVMPRIFTGISRGSEGALCQAAIFAASEVVRALGAAARPYFDQLSEVLLTLLRNGDTAREVKPAAIALFGDMALGLGTDVRAYMHGMLLVIERAATIPKPREEDEDEVDFIYRLRNGVVDAWSGIIQAFLPEDDASADTRARLAEAGAELLPFVQSILSHLLQYVRDISREMDTVDVGYIKALDLATLVGKAKMPTYLPREALVMLHTFLDRAATIEREALESTHDEAGERIGLLADFCRQALPVMR